MKVTYIILFVIALSYSDCGETKASIYKKHVKRVRCTRRYTPGTCLEAVKTVWSYVPHQQDCAERLGCVADLYANRFNTIEQCNETCRELIYLYMFLQEADRGNFTIPNQEYEDEDEDLESPEQDMHRIVEDYGIHYEQYHRGSNVELIGIPFNSFEENQYDAYSVQTSDRRYIRHGDRPPVPDSEDVRALREHMLPDIDNF